MSPFPVKEKNRTALKCGALSVNTQLSILCGENWVYKWLSCADFSVGYSNLPLNAVIYFHWFPAVMDFAWTTSSYLTLRTKHMSAYVHLCRHKHARRHTLYYDNDHVTLLLFFFLPKSTFGSAFCNFRKVTIEIKPTFEFSKDNNALLATVTKCAGICLGDIGAQTAI